jgi:hypothetical protein
LIARHFYFLSVKGIQSPVGTGRFHRASGPSKFTPTNTALWI